MSQSPQAIVEAFVGKWNAAEVPGAFAMMAEDAVWENLPMGSAKGMSGIQAVMAQFPPIEGIEFVTHRIATKSNIVMTERADKFLIGGRWREIRLM
jgi:limonene-1,2-epoxide hydrolase